METPADYERIKAELERIKAARTASTLKWQRANIEKVKAKKAEWYENNKEKERMRSKAYQASLRAKAKEEKALTTPQV